MTDKLLPRSPSKTAVIKNPNTGVNIFTTIVKDENGKVVMVLLTQGKAATFLSEWVFATQLLINLALAKGITPEEIAKVLIGQFGEGFYWDNCLRPSIPSVVGELLMAGGNILENTKD